MKEVLIELIRVKAIFNENENNNIIIESIKVTIAFSSDLVNNLNKEIINLINFNIDVIKVTILKIIKERLS